MIIEYQKSVIPQYISQKDKKSYKFYADFYKIFKSQINIKQNIRSSDRFSFSIYFY